MPVKILDNITVIECATFVGAPVGFDNSARERTHPQALVSEHNAKVLRELGDSDGDITALRNGMITNAAA